jgi:hypothetical protein
VRQPLKKLTTWINTNRTRVTTVALQLMAGILIATSVKLVFMAGEWLIDHMPDL